MTATARQKYLNAMDRVRPVAIRAIREASGRTEARDLLESWRKRDPRLMADLIVVGIYHALDETIPLPPTEDCDPAE